MNAKLTCLVMIGTCGPATCGPALGLIDLGRIGEIMLVGYITVITPPLGGYRLVVLYGCLYYKTMPERISIRTTWARRAVEPELGDS